jgi:hypothetical protein
MEKSYTLEYNPLPYIFIFFCKKLQYAESVRFWNCGGSNLKLMLYSYGYGEEWN